MRMRRKKHGSERIAACASLLIPLIFVRMGVGFTEMLYRLMLLAAAANMVLLSVM